MEELISVILPVYKTDIKLFQSAVESVLNQTYKNFQLIIIDNGSDEPIYDKYLSSDPRIEYVHLKQGGLANARNEGLKIAKGEYVSFIDADDLYSPLYLETLHKMSKDYDSDFSICCYSNDYNVFVNSKTLYALQVFKNDDVLNKLLSYYFEPKKITPDFPLLPVVWNILIKKEKVGQISFDIDLLVLEDIDFLIKLCLNSTNVTFTHSILYYYREVETSMSREVNDNFFVKYYDSLSTIYLSYLDAFDGEVKNEFFSAIFKYSLNNMCKAKKAKNKKYIENFKYLCKKVGKNVVFRSLTFRRKILFVLFKLKLYFLIFVLYSQL